MVKLGDGSPRQPVPASKIVISLPVLCFEYRGRRCDPLCAMAARVLPRVGKGAGAHSGVTSAHYCGGGSPSREFHHGAPGVDYEYP